MGFASVKVQVVRLHEHVTLIAEGLEIFEDAEPGGLLGVRLFNRRFAADVAAALTLTGETLVYPWLALSFGW